MKKSFTARRVLFALGALALFVSQPLSALAQCAMCRASVQTGGHTTIEPLNLAILVLLIPPALIFCAIFCVAYRYRKGMDDRQPDALRPAQNH